MLPTMTSDDQHFLDVLSSIPHHAANAIDRHFDQVSDKLRQSLESATWLPDFARPRRPPPPPSSFAVVRGAVPAGILRSTYDWIWDHRHVVCPVIAFIGTTAFLYHRRSKAYVKKRRARRANNGAKTEVVVVVGMFQSPMTRSVILDLERRGFIVYVVAGTAAEERTIKDEHKSDILPLHLDVTDPQDVESTMSHFSRTLNTPQHAHPGSEPHRLSFSGVIIIPDVTYPVGPVETVSQELWADAINAKILGTIVTAQAFTRPLVDFQARLIVVTPGVIPALGPPFHSVETTVVRALEGFTDSLSSELATVGVRVCQLRLGSFDLSGSSAAAQPLSRRLGQEVLGWPSFAREAYRDNFLAQKHDAFMKALRRASASRGSPLRELNNAVFDTLAGARPSRVQRIGQGSSMYAAVGALTPASLVRWMMGIRATQTQGRRLSHSDSWEQVEK